MKTKKKIKPDTQCRDLKYLISPDFHTTKVREAVARITAGKQ